MNGKSILVTLHFKGNENIEDNFFSGLSESDFADNFLKFMKQSIHGFNYFQSSSVL